MKSTWLAGLCLAALGASGTLHAADARDRAPVASAFLTLSFGGDKASAADQRLRYGMMIDHDRRFADAPPAPMFTLTMSPQGFDSAALNGLPFAYRMTQVNQAGEALEYSVFDYGLVALGVVGLGFAVAEIADAEDETPDPTAAPDNNGSSGEDSALGGLLDGVGDIVDGILGGGGFRDQPLITTDVTVRSFSADPMRGDMGDLHAR